MPTPEDVIGLYIDATSAADGDAAAALMADGGLISLNHLFPSPEEAAAAA